MVVRNPQLQNEWQNRHGHCPILPAIFKEFTRNSFLLRQPLPDKLSQQNVTTDCCYTLLEKIKAKKIDIFDTFIYFPHGKYICSVNVL